MKRQEDNSRSFRAIWAVLSPYWWGDERWLARFLLLVIVAMNLGLVYLSVLFNRWNRYFYDALQAMNYDEFKVQLLRFTVLAFIYIAISVYRIYLTQMLEIKWRRWLTDRYIKTWLNDQVYYRMSLGVYSADNPDQRIAEDFRLFTSGALSLSLGLLSAVVSIVSFVGILWALSGSLSFTLFGSDITIHGYLVWIALVYSVVGSFLAHAIGRPLIGLNFLQQRYEADFRFNLVRVRENAEGIALYEGEGVESRNLGRSFTNILQNWWKIMICQKRLTWFTASYTQVAIIFPFVVSAPRYFTGAIQLGGLMQVVSAFANVQSNLSWFIDNYSRFADWRASADRLAGFNAALEKAVVERVATRPGFAYDESGVEELGVENVEIDLPDGRELRRDINLRVKSGEKVLVRGPSGSGKSTFFRVMAGIWPYASGSVSAPPRKARLFLPQTPYIPIGTLRAAIAYPEGASAYDDESMRRVMTMCRLEHLQNRLDESAHWEQVLSPGEQQLVAFARALLHKPAWLFLDEATSSTDDATQDALYEALLRELPGSAIISIAHRPGVERYHQREFRMK